MVENVWFLLLGKTFILIFKIILFRHPVDFMAMKPRAAVLHYVKSCQATLWQVASDVGLYTKDRTKAEARALLKYAIAHSSTVSSLDARVRDSRNSKNFRSLWENTTLGKHYTRKHNTSQCC